MVERYEYHMAGAETVDDATERRQIESEPAASWRHLAEAQRIAHLGCLALDTRIDATLSFTLGWGVRDAGGRRLDG